MRETSRTRAPRLAGPGERNRGGSQAVRRGRPQQLAYPWLRLHLSNAQRAACIVGFLAGIGLAYVYRQYLQGNEVAADSVYGLGFAVAGTLLLTLVGAGYTLRKRWKERWPGRLHTFLVWHIVGGLLGLLLIWMHTAGSFDQPSGTYAFYGLLGIVISGIVGRIIDSLCSRLAASAALVALNARGEDRLEELASAYERSRGRRAQALRSEARTLQRALRREQFWLFLIRLWRPIHIFISLVAASLLVWHLIFALNWLLIGS